MGRKANDVQEVTALKKEIRSLKKEIGRLNKELTQVGLAEDDYLESLGIEEEPEGIRCGGCKSAAILEFITPSGAVRYFCKDCQWRGAA